MPPRRPIQEEESEEEDSPNVRYINLRNRDERAQRAIQLELARLDDGLIFNIARPTNLFMFMDSFFKIESTDCFRFNIHSRGAAVAHAMTTRPVNVRSQVIMNLFLQLHLMLDTLPAIMAEPDGQRPHVKRDIYLGPSVDATGAYEWRLVVYKNEENNPGILFGTYGTIGNTSYGDPARPGISSEMTYPYNYCFFFNLANHEPLLVTVAAGK